MAHTEDVERLFSWLKAPMVHYREFAAQREVSEAAATWPIAHRAASQVGSAAANEPAPQGDMAARERIARDSRVLPGAAPLMQHVPEAEAAPYGPPPDGDDGRLHDHPSQAGNWMTVAEQPRQPVGVTEGRRQDVGPMIAGFDEPPQPLNVERSSSHESYETDRAGQRSYPARDRGQLLGGEYRGQEREVRPGDRMPVPDRQDRSLSAVFTRLSGGRERLPDPRGRARTNPGLGPVFSRLR